MATAESSVPPSIDELEKQLRDAERDLATKSSQRDSLKENIAAVKKTQMEFTQLADAYNKALEGLKAGKKELDEYYELKWRMLQGAIEKHRDDIDKVIEEYDRGIQNQRDTVKDLKDQEKKASLAYDRANAALLEKKNQFEEYKDYKARTDKTIKDAQGYKTRAEKEDDESHPASMYVLLLQMKATLDQVRVKAPDELNQLVQERWSEFYAASNEARDKKITLDDIKQKLKTEEILLQDSEQKRLDNILLGVSEYNKSTSPSPSVANRRPSASLLQH